MHQFIHHDNQERLTQMGFGILAKPYNREDYVTPHWSKKILDLHKYRSTESLRGSRDESGSLRLQTDRSRGRHAGKLSSDKDLKFGSKTLINNRLRIVSSRDLPDIACIDRSSNGASGASLTGISPARQKFRAKS